MLIRSNFKPGDTGHIAEHNAIGEKLNNGVFDVRDYGAKGDLSTDDTAAFQAAVDAAAFQRFGAEVFVPPAINGNGYRISKPVSLRRYVTVRGVGMASRLFGADPDAPILLADGLCNVRLLDLSFQWAGLPTDYAVRIMDSVDSWMVRCYGGPWYIGGVPQANGSGQIRLSQCVADMSYARLEKCQNVVIEGGQTYGVVKDHSGLELIDTRNCTFVGVVFEQAGKHGVEMVRSSRNTFLGCSAFNASYDRPGEYDCISIDGSSHNNRFFGGWVGNSYYYNSDLYEPHARYSVNIEAGATDNRFYGVNLGQATVDQVNDLGTGTMLL